MFVFSNRCNYKRSHNTYMYILRDSFSSFVNMSVAEVGQVTFGKYSARNV